MLVVEENKNIPLIQIGIYKSNYEVTLSTLFINITK